VSKHYGLPWRLAATGWTACQTCGDRLSTDNYRVIRKSVQRFSEKITRNQKAKAR
jgi:hypothetical protein